MSRITPTPTALLVMIAALAAPPAAQGDPEQAFYKAFYLEHALRDLEGAQKAYSAAASVAIDASQEALAVRAYVQRGRCLRSLGRAAEAKRIFERALA